MNYGVLTELEKLRKKKNGKEVSISGKVLTPVIEDTGYGVYDELLKLQAKARESREFSQDLRNRANELAKERATAQSGGLSAIEMEDIAPVSHYFTPVTSNVDSSGTDRLIANMSAPVKSTVQAGGMSITDAKNNEDWTSVIIGGSPVSTISMPEEKPLTAKQKAKYWTEWITGNINAGTTAVTTSLGNTLDATVGNILKGVGWENNPVSKLNEGLQRDREMLLEVRDDAAEKLDLGKWADYVESFTEGAVAAVPMALEAMFTGGANIVPTAANLADDAIRASGTLLQKLGLTTSSMMKNPQFWMSYTQTYGNEYYDAIESGASEEAAVLTATAKSLINSGIEIGIDGGSGMQGLMDDVAKGGKKLLSWVESSIEEGMEEVVQGFISRLVDKFALGKDVKVLDPWTSAQEFGMGTAVGAILGGGQTLAVNSVSNAEAKARENYLTETEKKVIDREVENRIKKAEESGKKVTKNDIKKIEKAVKEEMEKGYLSTDLIEEVLGGETYKSYQNTTNEIKQIEDQLKELEKEPNTVGNSKKFDSLQAKLEELRNNFQKDQVKNKLSEEVKGLVQGSRLMESYNEKARAYEDLQIDADTFNSVKHADAAKQTIESAVKLGANNTNRVRDLVENAAKFSGEMGKPILFKSGEDIKNSFVQRQTQAIEKLEAKENRTAAENKLLESMKQKLEDVKSGKTTVHGEYSKDGIVLNIDSNKPFMLTVGHEITHRAETAKSYDKMVEALFGYAKLKNIDVQTRIDMAMAEYEGIQDSDAKREVVADLVGELLFTDDAFVERLANTNTNVFQRLWNDVKHMLKMVNPGSKEARELERLQYRFEKAYQEANKAKENAAEGVDYKVDGNPDFNGDVTETQNEGGLDTKQEVDYSLSRNTEFMDKAISKNDFARHVTSDAMNEAKVVREKIAARMNEIKDRGLVGLPEDIEGNTYIANSSYDGTEENTTICPRSLAAEAFVDAVSEYLGRPLTVEEQIYISQDLQGRSLTPECTYCYVATDRKAYRAFLGEYINQRDAVIDKIRNNPDANVSRNGELYQEFLNGRKDTNPMYSRFKMWVDAYKSGKPMVEASHLANINKLMGDINSVFGAELKPQITDAMKYAQSASWAKKRVDYVAYNGHILNWKQDRINKLNSHYGLRMYSFSDFHPAFVLENMQMITDASVRGLKMLGYTKDTDFVEIFAPSGMNINVSTFGFSAGGNVYENNLIGAEWEKAKALRDQYPNVGITFVATDDNIVNWALEQDWIDVVIPYHLVRTGAEVAKAFGYTNYTSESSDTKGAGWIKGKDQKYIAPTEHNNDKATYMAALERNHLRPRFERFADNPNYMKLVNECRQPASKSKPVQPVFNEDAAMVALAKLEANGYYQPVGGSVDRMYEVAAEVADNMTKQLAPVQESLSSSSDTYDIWEGVNATNFRNKSTEVNTDIAPVAENAALVAENDTIAAEEITPAIAPTSVVNAPESADDTAPLPPGSKRRKWVGTSTASEVVDGQVAPEDLDQDLIHYQPISNKKTLGNANAMLDSKGYDASVAYMSQRFAANRVSLDDIALGERLIQEAVKRGDTKTAQELIMDISILGTELGQKVQALSIIKRLTPEGQLKMLMKVVERGKAKGDKAFNGVEVTQEQAAKILDARKPDGTFDQAELNKAVEDVKQEIADNMSVSMLEVVNEWRYLAMLGNPKTHIRNLVSNAAMLATRQVKNAVARTVEGVVGATGKNIHRTKTWKAASQYVRDYANKVTNEEYAGTTGNKYSESGDIKSKRNVLGNNVFGAASKFNSAALTAEDKWFSKPAFRESFREYLTANGIRTEADVKKNGRIVAEAKAYAAQQAKEATFQKDSYVASKINEIEGKNPLFNMAIGAVLPFKKTPINIAKTGLAYSPLGIARNIYDTVKVAKGEMEVSEAIDHVAQTLTGTSLALIGYALASNGILNGAGGDDKEDKYDYQLGKQSYSFNFDGDTFSLSWLSPVAMPLFVGANAYEQLVEDQEWDYNVVMEALAQTLDPLNEMSFLSSLSDVLSSYDSGMAAFGGMLETAAQSYVTSFVPTLSSQIAQISDDKKRSTKISANSSADFLEETWNAIKYKVPGLRQTLEPATDIWGNEIALSDDAVTKALETFIAPYARKEDISTKVDDEIKNIYRLTGNDGVIPNIPGNSVNYKNEKYEMSAAEYTQFKKDYGQTAYDLMDALIQTDTYQRASADDKAKWMDEVFSYAMDEAKKNYLAKQGVSYTNSTKDGVPYYRENAIKGAIENDMTPEEYKLYRDDPEKFAMAEAVGGLKVYDQYKDATKDMKLGEKADYIAGMDLSTEQKNLLINSETDRKEPIDLAGIEEYSSFEEFEFAKKYPGKYAMAKAVGGYDSYIVYADALGDIETDKDEWGQSIKDSRTPKVFAYIYSLDIPEIEKHILFKSEYNSFDDYNYEIIEYLSNRDDISYDEMVSLLLDLGFKVSTDGMVRW